MQSNAATLPLPSLPLFLALFVVVWIFTCQVIGWASGWHALSQRFTRQSEPYGDTRSAGPFFYGVYTRFKIHYSSVIRMTASDNALYLSVLFLFRPGHPPLCIPWQEIELGRTRFFWGRYVELTLGKEERIPMYISERMAAKLGILGRLPSDDFQG